MSGGALGAAAFQLVLGSRKRGIVDNFDAILRLVAQKCLLGSTVAADEVAEVSS